MPTSPPSSHLFHIASTSHKTTLPYGERLDVTADEMPILKGMGLSLLQLAPHGIREPHWHPNANELSYCLEGRGLMTIFSPGNGHNSLILEPGTLAMVPKGYFHHIENSGQTPLKLLLCFDDERFEELNLSSAVTVMPNHILGATFQLPATFFADLPHQSLEPAFITAQQQPVVPPLAYTTNFFKFNLEATHPQVQTAGGWVKMSNYFSFPALEGLAVYSVALQPKGAREPHWHPNAAELNVLVQGRARITILSPSGHVETFDMVAGDLSFMPRGYLHHIENIGSEEVRFVIFFNHTAPSDIGISGCMGAYSNQVLASLFHCDPAYFEQLPKDQYDLLVVKGGG